MNSELVQQSQEVIKDQKAKRFRQELKKLTNEYSMENGSDTPDFLLAEYLGRSLELFDIIVARREQWYDRGSTLDEEKSTK